MRTTCQHCGKVLRSRSPGRGLCWVCYRNPAVKAQYDPRIAGRRCKGYEDDYEPTGEELEKTIARQMSCLPAWWDAERDETYFPKVYQLVKCT